MLRRLRPRSLYDVLATLAFFGVVTGGVAYAANTIGSSDIIDESILSRDIKNGQVGTGDLAANAVRTGKVLDESLTGHDIKDDTIGGADVNEALLDPLTSPQIQDESLTGHDIQDNTIGGADVNETLLDPLTSPQIQDESLTGHDIQDNTIGGADVNESFLPAASTFANHNPTDFELSVSYQQVIWTGDQVNGSNGGPASIHLDAPGRVFVTASLQFATYNQDASGVRCRLGLIKNGVTTDIGYERLQDFRSYGNFVLPSSGGIQVAPGNYAANVRCRGHTAVYFQDGTLLFWATPA